MPIHASDRIWILETATTGYALGLNAADVLSHCYWGKRLHGPEDYPAAPNPKEWAAFNGPAHLTNEEFPAYAGTKYTDPCLKLTFADGTRDTVLHFESADVADGDKLHIHLRDSYYAVRVTLHYRVHERHDLIERWVTVTNLADPAALVEADRRTGTVGLERIFSAQWHLPRGDDYRLSHVNGRWLDEWHIRREPLVQGLKIIDSRRLTPSHNHNPWFAVDRGSADEQQGEVWFGVLGWSGNWKISAEVTDFLSTRLNIGLNDWDFAWDLGPGQQFSTPPAYAGYTPEGFGAASRHLHDFIREKLLPNPQVTRKVLYNSWEATFFDVDEESQARLAEIAAQMGVELFVVDDGWFHGRVADVAGLGDWWPDERKFPNGLGLLIQRVNALGMDFGLWIEPEMVNPDSDLYRQHPDWIIHFPTRTPTTARNQLILNLARSDVQDYIIAHIDRLLTENNIRFIKWDMNRNVSEPGWPDAPGDPRELWVRYVYGLYRVWDTLRERHPEVIWQSCSGGGGRADLGILRRADQIWISDNTEAAARLSIQEGFSQIFPANTMEAWVTDVQEHLLPLEFRFHVSMCALLGVGGQLLRWSEADRATAARCIARYKEIRHIVQNGDLYRLRSPQVHAISALQYVSKDRSEGVLFGFRTFLPHPAQIPLTYPTGLDPVARYEIEGCGAPRSGLAWMSAGVHLELNNFQSTVRSIRRVG